MSGRLKISLEFVRSEKSSDPYSFQFGAQKYLCRDATRHEYDELTLDWDERLLGLLEQLQRPGVSAEVLAELGQRLTTFLAPAGIRAHEDRIVEAIGRGEAVEVVLSSSAAELYSLPWELLRLRSTGQLLGEIPNCLIRHVWPGVKSDVPQSAAGRLLVGWSAAGGPVPSRAHVAGISHAQGGHLEFDPDRDVVADISLRTLDQRLASLGDQVRALHILCHGGEDGLAFDAVDGMDKVVVDARMLQTLIAPYANQLTLVVICACHGGDGGSLGTRLGSAAQALHRAGVDAVVASRFPLSTAGSITLAETLYGELARNGGDLRGAFLRAKRALALDSGKVDHVSLQLYAHENALHWAGGPTESQLLRLKKWHAEQAADASQKLGAREAAPAPATASSREPAPAASQARQAAGPTPATSKAAQVAEPAPASPPKQGMPLAAKVGAALAALAACAGLIFVLTRPPESKDTPSGAEVSKTTPEPPESTKPAPETPSGAPGAPDPPAKSAQSKSTSPASTKLAPEAHPTASKGTGLFTKRDGDCGGNDIQVFDRQTLAECQARCADDGCLGVSYQDSDGRCVTKSATCATPDPASGHIFYEKRAKSQLAPGPTCSDLGQAKGHINSAQVGHLADDRGEAAQAYDEVVAAQRALKSGPNSGSTGPIYRGLQKQIDELKGYKDRGCTTMSLCDDLREALGRIYGELGDPYNKLGELEQSLCGANG